MSLGASSARSLCATCQHPLSCFLQGQGSFQRGDGSLQSDCFIARTALNMKACAPRLAALELLLQSFVASQGRWAFPPWQWLAAGGVVYSGLTWVPPSPPLPSQGHMHFSRTILEGSKIYRPLLQGDNSDEVAEVCAYRSRWGAVTGTSSSPLVAPGLPGLCASLAR